MIVVHHDFHLADGRVIVETPHGELPDHVPTLAAALDACAGAWVNIEIKNTLGEPDFDPDDGVATGVVVELDGRGSDEGPWLISSFRLETVDRCRSSAPEVPTAWLVAEVDAATPQVTADHGHTALHPWHGAVSAAVIERCHALALAVNVWTCDDTGRAAELAGWGVDGIVTNTPDVIRAALGA